MSVTAIIPVEEIQQRIFSRSWSEGDARYAPCEIYGVQTKNLNKAVARNKERFPNDFMFQLTEEEWNALRFQIGTSRKGTRGGRRYLPHAFTEHGAGMLASVLNSPVAVRASIQVVRVVCPSP